MQTLERSPSELNRGGIPGSALICLRIVAAEGGGGDGAFRRSSRTRCGGGGGRGMSRNAAAKRFGVSIASAVRWVARFKTKGEISPAATGGDRRSGRIEAHRDYLLGLVRRRPDMTLLEIQERLIGNCGERFSSSVLWRFFDRHELTFKNVWPAPSARGFCRDCRLISLLQRIRPRGTSSGQDGDTRADMIPVDRSPL